MILGTIYQASLNHGAKVDVDVMITIFGDYCLFSAKILALFSKNNVMIHYLNKLTVF
jgi:CRISPR/Cas system-associated endonuclease Cas1